MKIDYNLIDDDDQIEEMLPQKDISRIKKKVRVENRKEYNRRLRHNRLQEERDEDKNKEK